MLDIYVYSLFGTLLILLVTSTYLEFLSSMALTLLYLSPMLLVQTKCKSFGFLWCSWSRSPGGLWLHPMFIFLTWSTHRYSVGWFGLLSEDIGKRGKVSVEDAKFNVFLFCMQILYLSFYLSQEIGKIAGLVYCYLCFSLLVYLFIFWAWWAEHENLYHWEVTSNIFLSNP